MPSLLGWEITERATGNKWRITGSGPSATRYGAPVWIATPVTEFGQVEEFTITELQARFDLPEDAHAEQPEPVVERPIDTLAVMTARERRMRRKLTPKPITRNVRDYSPEQVLAGAVPDDYKPRAQEIASGIVDDPAKLRDFFVNGHRYSQPVRAAVANLLGERA